MRLESQWGRTGVKRGEEVRDFYERLPYPPPLTSLDDLRELYKNADRRRAIFHRGVAC